ncbi:MAG TPA: SAM-dependent methyltransferase [Chlamydiales bacterium]|nr:SAM-dependent methyltransferase [Chlamydiales bacterium]
MLTAYLASRGFEQQLKQELKGIIAIYDRLFLTDGPAQKVYWAENIWHVVEKLPFNTIKEASDLLRSRLGLWSHFPYQNLGRAKLITDILPYFAPKPISFPAKLSFPPVGAWTLLEPNLLLASAKTESRLPNGEYHFHECKEGPPSRAYLKLWEVLTRIGKEPQKDDQCLELGASPGSWTWVLQKLGAKVFAFDRAPLDPKIQSLPGVKFEARDAFSLKPQDFPDVKWVFSDVICYPEKLFEWLEQWLPLPVHLVCTIKFQGEGGYSILEKFAAIPNSQIFHLFHNKHELTFVRN